MRDVHRSATAGLWTTAATRDQSLLNKLDCCDGTEILLQNLNPLRCSRTDMTHTGIRSRATGIFAGAGALSLLLGATALLVAPSANADQTAVAGSQNPPGNNGTVKIEGADI